MNTIEEDKAPADLNADCLQPYLERMKALFPGMRVGVRLTLEHEPDYEVNDSHYRASASVNHDACFSETLNSAIEKVKLEYGGDKAVRAKAADAFIRAANEQAELIRSGKAPIPTA